MIAYLNKTLQSRQALCIDQRILDHINNATGKTFSIDFAQTVIKKISNKYPDRNFVTKKQLQKYLVKVFSFEKRNNSDLVECKLSKLEKDTSNSTISKIQRKIIANFSANEAYNIINNISFFDNKDYFTVKMENIDLKEHQKQKIDQIIKEVAAVEYTKYQSYNADSKEEILQKKVKNTLISIYGKEMYISWFSKLKLQIIDNNRYVFIAPTKFIADWINQHYRDAIFSCVKLVTELPLDLEVCV